MRQLVLRNRQRIRAINTRWLRSAASRLLETELELQRYALAVHLVEPQRMAALNEKFLAHQGSTDVISFDFRNGYADPEYNTLDLAGEIFISLQDAVTQAREFHTTWQDEVLRYLVHGVLHLRGYDDMTPQARRAMKREEDRLVRNIRAALPIQQLSS